MPIQVLPPQLANQIAAGEVVERPASVVKELVENSLDAGATRIDIDIEKGGSKLIRIRDNGAGIPKEELALALSRHATSKLHTLDDLEAIMSFGFRGEALASISSVSRLSLTSKTAEQTEAWQAYAEGSQMAVKVIPAAHPVGTTLDVVDLFFNTPARRRFLKSDKTEFAHIDEWLKRIALVRADIHFTLQHNGKTVRNYRPAHNESQYLQRLGQISGRAFADQALRIDCDHDGLTLSGYLQSPLQHDMSHDTHYFYVNGRLVRDRLVNHAVRQAFAELAEHEQPSYVLMLALDPHQVDVNVHPAKHEVRFHQSRYVHDYILQALQSALRQLTELPLAMPQSSTQTFHDVEDSRGLSQHDYQESDNHAHTESHLLSQASGSSGISSRGARPNDSYIKGQDYPPSPDYSAASRTPIAGYSPSNLYGSNVRERPPSASATASYGALLATPSYDSNVHSQVDGRVATPELPMPVLLNGQYWVMVTEEKIRLLDVKQVAIYTRRVEIEAKLATGIIGQPLLMPVSVSVDAQWSDILQQREQLLRQLGLELTIRYQQLIIKKVPPYLRDSQLVKVIPELLQWIELAVPTHAELASWIAKQSTQGFVSAPLVWEAYSALAESDRQQLIANAIDLPWQLWLEQQLVTKVEEQASE